jgi:hypothetical protein
MSGSVSEIDHARGFVATHDDRECPLGYVQAIMQGLQRLIPHQQKALEALQRVLDEALDNNGDDQAPEYWCHYCGARAAYQADGQEDA